MHPWTDHNVLVTGATGLLGGWLVKRLLAEGAAVTCVVRDHVPLAPLLSERWAQPATLVRGDVTDQALLERVLGEGEIQTVFHLAAQAVVGVANRNPVSTFDSNVRGTWALLEACRRSPAVRAITVASSDKAYGDHGGAAYTEDMPLLALAPYDVSKACADMLARSYAETFDLPVGITRCGNFYGGGDLNWSRLVPGTLRSLIRGARPVIRSDGSPVRDYLYVEDAVDAYLALATRLAEDPSIHGRAYNFSHEHPVRVLDIVELTLAVMDSDLEPMVLNESSGGLPFQALDTTRARTELNWSPQIDLAEGMSRTAEWYQRHLASGPGAP
jgi:CDP-glucose 4,6-dehydratase